MESNTQVVDEVKVKIDKPRRFKVIMYNDDYTTMEFVVDILQNVFNKSGEEAVRVMRDVHEKGMGVAGIYCYDIAHTKVSMSMKLAKEKGFPFKLSVEEV
jgi:ATP-dependent Clp protease adaptor protein ClpS